MSELRTPLRPVLTGVSRMRPHLRKNFAMGAFEQQQQMQREVPKVGYRPSHNHLLTDVRPAMTEIPDGVRESSRFPGLIVVPTSSSLTGLMPPGILLALELGSKFDAQVLILCSGEARAADLPANLGMVFQDVAVLIDIEDLPAHLMPKLPSYESPLAAFHRKADQGIKRTIGLAAAISLKAEFVLFVDDDIIPDEKCTGADGEILTLSSEGLARAVQVMAEDLTLAALGWASCDLPDNSVIGHARRLATMRQDVFLGGNALLVRLTIPGGTCPRPPAFATIYNEDWLFILELMARESGPARIGYAGTVRQNAKRVFRNPRAVAEEPGDLIGETLMNLFEDYRSHYLSVAKDLDLWRRSQTARRRLNSRVRKRLDGVKVSNYDWHGDEVSYFPADCLGAAYTASFEFTPDDILQFLELLAADGPAGSDYLERVCERDLRRSVPGLRRITPRRMPVVQLVASAS